MTEPTRGDRTRAAIVQVAGRHLAARGLDGMRGAMVAAEADVSEATVWFHFGTKVGLLVAVMDDYYDGLVADLTAVVDGETSPADRLVAFARAWFVRIDADMALVAELGRHGRQGHAPEAAARFAACNRRVTQLFERLVEDLVASGDLRDDVPPRFIRDAFFGSAEHILIGRHLTGRGGDLVEAADRLLDVLLHGLQQGAARPAGSLVAPSSRPDPTLASIDAKLDRILAGG